MFPTARYRHHCVSFPSCRLLRYAVMPPDSPGLAEFTMRTDPVFSKAGGWQIRSVWDSAWNSHGSIDRKVGTLNSLGVPRLVFGLSEFQRAGR